jgi:hypothetical protein
VSGHADGRFAAVVHNRTQRVRNRDAADNSGAQAERGHSGLFLINVVGWRLVVELRLDHHDVSSESVGELLGDGKRACCVNGPSKGTSKVLGIIPLLVASMMDSLKG